MAYQTVLIWTLKDHKTLTKISYRKANSNKVFLTSMKRKIMEATRRHSFHNTKSTRRILRKRTQERRLTVGSNKSRRQLMMTFKAKMIRNHKSEYLTPIMLRMTTI